jgi:hypothetical protein
LPLVQETTISNQGGFYPSVVEAALDYLMMCIQQVAQTGAGGGGGGPSPGPPSASGITVVQIKLQLIQNNQMYQIENVIPADVANTVNVQWNTGGFTKVGDALSNLIASTLGYTPSQMTALYTSASFQQPP